MRGFDPDFDRLTLLREDFGRRTNSVDPGQSLLLLKPAMQVAHGGGMKLRKGDLTYSTLHRWVAAGCPDDAADAPRCVRIEVTPHQGEWPWSEHEQKLLVRAFFADDSVRDITRLATYTSSDEGVAEIDADGLVRGVTRGETTIMVRYLDLIDTADMRFLQPVEGFAWEAPPVRNEIDELVFARLKKLQIPPSSLCTDTEFLRRVSLDLTGILPARAEAEAFFADTSIDKRARLIDRLLERPEHAEYWGQKRGDLLRAKRSKIGDAGVHKFHQWLVRTVRVNMPYDEFARALLTAQGSTFVNPASNFYRASSSVNDAAETTSQLFLGIRIQCAKCHNHPFDRWSQDNYYGIGAIFGRVQQKQLGESDEVAVWLDRHSEVTQPRTGQTMKSWLPLTGEVDVPENADRRAAFARWLTAPDNPFFARVAVNRIWGQLFGRGIVEPVDDFRADNPPSHPQLLDTLAKHFVESGFDQKGMIRTILNSSLYQLSSRSLPLNKDDDKYFSHAHARLLSAEQLLDAVSQVTGIPEEFRGLPPGMTATTLPSPDFGNDFLKVFGQPARNTVCECERTHDPKLAQTLQMINGSLIPGKLRDSRSRLGILLDDQPARVAAAGEPVREGLVSWFRADTGVMSPSGLPAANEGAVSRWENRINARLHGEQVDPDQRPRFVSNAVSGLPAIRFDGVNDFLHNTQENVLPSGSPRTVIVLGQLADHSTGGALFTFRRGRLAGSSVFTVQYASIGGTCYVYSDGVNGAGNTTVPAERLNDLSSPFMTTFLSPGAGEKLQVMLNGEDANPAQPGGVGPDEGVTGFTIGSREDIPLGSQIWKGDISEVLVYDRVLTQDQLQDVGSYLSTRYALKTRYPQKKTPVDARSRKADAEIITEFYYAALSRPPSSAELKFAETYIEEFQDRRRGLEDIAWALMNSKEFVFQH